MSGSGFSVMFSLIMQVTQHSGLTPPLTDLFTTKWVDDDVPVVLKINGAKEERDLVPPFHAALYINGWPATLVHPMGGIVLAGTEEEATGYLQRRLASLTEDIHCAGCGRPTVDSDDPDNPLRAVEAASGAYVLCARCDLVARQDAGEEPT